MIALTTKSNKTRETGSIKYNTTSAQKLQDP